MKILFTLSLMMILTACHAQDTLSVREGNPKKDEAFSKTLNIILAAYGKDFAALPKHFEGRDIVDSTWIVDLLLPGADEAKFTKSKGSIILFQHFAPDKLSLDKLLEKVKATLPADYRYSLNYDAPSQISNYTFTRDAKATSHPGYPAEFYLGGDRYSASLSFVIFK